MKKWLVLGFLIMGLAFADSPIDGLTLALHPEGEWLIAGGKNRTLYKLDAETLEVMERSYFGSTINRLAFSADGKVLFLQDSEPDIYVLAADTLKVVKTLGGYGAMQLAPAANLLLAYNDNYNGDTLTLFDMKGNEIQSLTFGEEDDIASVGISPDGSKVAVFFDSFDSENEEDVSWSDIPDEYEGFAKDVYAEQNDGEEARYILYSLPELEVLADYVGFYTPYDDQLVFFQGDDALIINSSNENARYSLDGTVEMWEWPGNSSGYGRGVSLDHNVLVVGGLADATIYDFAASSESSFDIDDVPGASEYFVSFVVADDGTIYGSTEGYRVVKVKQAGAGVSKTVQPVY